MTAKALFDWGFPTALSDSQATALGMKRYLSGTTYNNGVAATWSGSNWTTSQGVSIPYQLQDGTWRIKFCLTGDVAGASSNNQYQNISLAGITTIAFYQGIAVYDAGAQGRGAAMSAAMNPSASTIVMLWGNTSTFNTTFSFVGDFAITAKPTWAY